MIARLESFKKDVKNHIRFALIFANTTGHTINDLEIKLEGQQREYQMMVNNKNLSKKIEPLQESMITVILIPTQVITQSPQLSFKYQIGGDSSQFKQNNLDLEIANFLFLAQNKITKEDYIKLPPWNQDLVWQKVSIKYNQHRVEAQKDLLKYFPQLILSQRDEDVIFV